MRSFKSLAFSLIAMLAVGCVDLEETFTINPDGSGKVVIDAIIPSQSSDGAAPPEAALKKRLTETVMELLTDSEGVAAWEHVSAQWREDGRIHFKGTAYFDNIEEFDLDGTPNVEVYLVRKRERIALRFGEQEEDDDDEKNKWKDDPAKLSDAQMRHGIALLRAEYQTGKPSFEAMGRGLKIDARFELPGDVVKAVGVKKVGGRTIRHQVDGDKLVSGMEKIMNKETDELVQMVKKAGTFDVLDFGDGRAPAFAALQGLSEEPHVVIQPDDKPQFDYQQAVAAARKGYQQLRKKLNLPDDANCPARRALTIRKSSERRPQRVLSSGQSMQRSRGGDNKAAAFHNRVLSHSKPEGDVMSTAKVIHVVASSSKSFDDAIRQGLADAARTLRGISGIKVTDFTAKVERDAITSYKVTMDVAFGIEEGSGEA